MTPSSNEQPVVCPACGRANLPSARTCVNCATALAAVSPLSDGDAAQSRRVQAEQEAVYAAELGTVHGGDWANVSTERKPGDLPLPPQLQAEALRREREQARRDAELRRQARERERAEEDRLRRERQRQEVEQEVAARRACATGIVCRQCGTPAPPSASGSSFSFCLNCGASFAPEAERRVKTVPDSGMPVVPPPPTVTSPVGVLQQQARREVRQPMPQPMRDQAVVAPQGDIMPVSEATPYVAAILSFLLPGAGQLRNAQWGKGLGIILATFAFIMFFGLSIWGVTGLILRALVALDAFRIAERRRRGERIGSGQWDCSFFPDIPRPRNVGKNES